MTRKGQKSLKMQHLLLVRDERQLGAALPQDLAAEQGRNRTCLRGGEPGHLRLPGPWDSRVPGLCSGWGEWKAGPYWLLRRWENWPRWCPNWGHPILPWLNLTSGCGWWVSAPTSTPPSPPPGLRLRKPSVQGWKELRLLQQILRGKSCLQCLGLNLLGQKLG